MMKTEYKTSTLHQTEKRKEKEKMETEGKKGGKENEKKRMHRRRYLSNLSNLSIASRLNNDS